MSRYFTHEAEVWLKTEKKNELVRKFPSMFTSVENLRRRTAGICVQIVNNPENNLYLLELLLACVLKLEHSNATDIEKSHSSDGSSIERVKLLAMMYFSIGAVLKDILPSYRVLTPEEQKKEGKIEGTASIYSARRTRELHLLSFYRRWLLSHFLPFMGRRVISVEGAVGSSIRKSTSIFAGDFLTAARLTNFAVQYVKGLINFVKTTNDPDITDPIVKSLRSAFRADLDLRLSAQCIPFLTGSIKGNLQAPVLLGLFSVVNALDIRKKETKAKAELASRNLREGPDLSKSRDKTERELDKKIMHLVSPSLIYGDYRAFKLHKTKILTELITFLVRLMRNSRNHPPELLFAAFHEFSRLTQFVNVELMVEIFTEFQQMCDTMLRCPDQSRTGIIIMGAVLACLHILKSAPPSSIEVRINEIFRARVYFSVTWETRDNRIYTALRLMYRGLVRA